MAAVLRRFRSAASLGPRYRDSDPEQGGSMRTERRVSIALLAGLAAMPLLAAAGALAQWLHGAG
jgi:hypothetical protein